MEPPVAPNPDASSCVRLRAVLIALAFIPVNAYWVVMMEAIKYTGHPTTYSLFFNVVTSHKRSRYPRAASTGATIYHYGWVRSEAQMNLKAGATHKYWEHAPAARVDYRQVDPSILRPFTGTHPAVMRDWLPPAEGLFQADPNHVLTRREKKHRRMLWLEEKLGWKFNRRHYLPVE